MMRRPRREGSFGLALLLLAPSMTLNVYTAAIDDTAAVEGNIDGLNVGVGTEILYRVNYTGGSAPAARLTRLQVIGVPIVQDAVGGFALRVEPNPSHGAIQFSCLGGRGDVVVWDVFDVRGRRVRSGREPVAGQRAPIVRWDRHDNRGMPVAPGVYLVRAQRGDSVARSRVVILR